MKLAIFPGDGIGPEITESTIAVISLLNKKWDLGLKYDTWTIGLETLAKEGTTLPEPAFEAARDADGIILGPLSTVEYPPKSEGGLNPSAEMRSRLDLYANLRPNKSRPGIPSWGRTPMDILIVRENTEGFYAARSMHEGTGEFSPVPGMVLSMRRITSFCSRRIAEVAVQHALKRRKKVTAVHKANVFQMSEAVFLKEVREVAAQHHVEYQEQLVDSMTALLIRDPQRFDVIVTTNMFGDILSDEAAELSGGLGLGGSLNAGDHHGMAQAQHGSAPDIAGKNIANPTSLLLSSCMLLHWLSERHQKANLQEAAQHLETSIEALLANPDTRTRDLGGIQSTKDFTKLLIAHLE